MPQFSLHTKIMKKYLLILACIFFSSCTNSTDVEDGIPAHKNLTGTWRTGYGKDTSHIIINAESLSSLIVADRGYSAVSYKGKTVSGEYVTYADGQQVLGVSFTMVTIDSFSSSSTYTIYNSSGAVVSSTKSSNGGRRVK